MVYGALSRSSGYNRLSRSTYRPRSLPTVPSADCDDFGAPTKTATASAAFNTSPTRRPPAEMDTGMASGQKKVGGPMSTNDFRTHGKEMVDYLADYMENISKRRVVPAIEPGYLRSRIKTEPPVKPESFATIMDDVEKHIMPGVTHWQHPRFHAYFPAGNSYPSILADMLSDGLGAACPALTELEMIMLDWFGKMLGLPPAFLPFTEDGLGGGVIQSTASECILVSLLAARFEMMKELRVRFPFVEEGLLASKLIAYCSKEAHAAVEKACMIGLVKLRILDTDRKFRLRGETLRSAIQEDRNVGLIPFFVSTTLGTTSCCSFDALGEIGPVCTEADVWLHVDAAYAGAALICPEFKHLLVGIEHAMSFNTNPNKWLLVNFDCSTMWVRDRFKLTQALVVDPLYLQHSWTDKAIDYRHWGIPLSRRFRSLKLWFVIRMYGVEGLQRYIREHVRLARRFEQHVLSDDRFEIVNEVVLGLVCFRLKGSNEMNQTLLTKLNSSGRIHMVPAQLNDTIVIRFCVCAENAADRDISIAWEIVRQAATHLLELESTLRPPLMEEDEMVGEDFVGGDYEDDANVVGAEEAELLAVNNDRHPLAGSVGSPIAKSYPPTSFADTDEEESAAAAVERQRQNLAYKRSFFVRMVSDPKCYNPKIVRHLNQPARKLSADLKRDLSLRNDIGTRLTRQTSGDRATSEEEFDFASPTSSTAIPIEYNRRKRNATDTSKF